MNKNNNVITEPEPRFVDKYTPNPVYDMWFTKSDFIKLFEKVKSNIQKDIDINGRNSDVVEGYTRSILIIESMINKVQNATLPEETK